MHAALRTAGSHVAVSRLFLNPGVGLGFRAFKGGGVRPEGGTNRTAVVTAGLRGEREEHRGGWGEGGERIHSIKDKREAFE